MALQNEKNSRYLLRDWKPENPAFWENKGKHIARRNLWISVSCLLLAFCVWMLFSAVTVNLNKIGFNFTTDQLFLLTALPSVSGALLRVPYSFMVPIFGGRRWTVFSTAILIIPCVWLGIAVQNPNTPFGIFIVIALLCGFAGANFASSMGNISFFFPKAKQGSALGINGGLGNLGVSVMQLVAPLVIFVPVFAFLGVNGVPQADGSVMSLANAAWIWVPLLAIATIAAWSGMNDIASSRASIADQLPVLQRLHLWLLSLLYLATFGSFIGFSAGFAMLAKTQFPDVNILRLAFFGPFIGAGLPIQVATTGHSKVMIPLKPEVDIDALSPDLNALTAISKQIGCNGFFPFQIRPGKNETDGRMFSPAIGIVEDPVTGNANGPMGAWLVHHNVLPYCPTMARCCVLKAIRGAHWGVTA